MNGIINENQLSIVKEYDFDEPKFHKVDSIVDKVVEDCHNKYFHTYEYKCLYDIKFTYIDNEIVNLTIADKSMNLYELNEKFENAPQNGFIFIQINNLKIEIYSSLSNLNIC